MNMRSHLCRWLSCTCLLGVLISAHAKSEAVADKPDDLVAQGDDFRNKGKLTEALWAYRQAAKAGDINGALAAGDFLLQQGKTATGRNRVLDLSEALGHLFVAATNQQSQACADLSEALQNGLGVKTNLVAAYAWLVVAAQTNSAFKSELDRLVVRLKTVEVLKAQQLAREYLAGHWPARVGRSIQQGDPRFKIQGVSQSPRGMLVILNGQTLAAGESANVFPANSSNHNSGQQLVVSCREIGSNYLLISVAGEASLKMLPIETR